LHEPGTPALGWGSAVEAHLALRRQAASGAHDPAVAMRAEAIRMPAPSGVALLTVGIELR
jgi:hypothetical protein